MSREFKVLANQVGGLLNGFMGDSAAETCFHAGRQQPTTAPEKGDIALF